MIGRDKEIKLLIQAIETHSIVLVKGPRQIGKTHLVQTVFECETTNELVVVDAKQESICDLDELCNAIKQKIESPLEIHADLSSLFQFLESENISLFVDSLEHLNQQTMETVFHQAASLFKKSCLITCSFVNVQVPLELFFEIFELKLQPLSKSSAKLYANLLLKQKKHQGSAYRLVDSILEKTGPNPGLIKTCIAKSLHHQTRLTDGDIVKIIKSTLKNYHQEIFEHQFYPQILMLALLTTSISKNTLKKIFSDEFISYLESNSLLDYNQDGASSFSNHLCTAFCSLIPKENHGVLQKELGKKLLNEASELSCFLECTHHLIQAKEYELACSVVEQIRHYAKASYLNPEHLSIMHLLISNLYEQMPTPPDNVISTLVELKFHIYSSNKSTIQKLVQKIKDPALKQLYVSGLTYQDGNYSECLELLDDLIDKNPSKDVLVEVLMAKARIKLAYGDLTTSKSFIEQTLELLSEDIKPIIRFKIFCDCSLFYCTADFNIFKAIDLAERACKLARTELPVEFYEHAMLKKAQCHVESVELDSAFELLEEVESLSNISLKSRNLHHFHTLKAEAFLLSGKTDDAYHLLNKNILCNCFNGSYSKELECRIFLTLCCALTNRFEEGIACGNRCIELCRLMRLNAGSSVPRYVLASVYLSKMEFDPALKLLSEAETYAKNFENIMSLATIQAYKSIIYNHINHSEKSTQEIQYQTLLNNLPLPHQKQIRIFKNQFQTHLTLHCQNSLITHNGLINDSDINQGSFEFYLDYPSNKLMVDQIERNIFKKPNMVKLLYIFVSEPGQSFSSGELFKSVWNRTPDDDTDLGTLRVNIRRLRKLLDPENPDRFIKNDLEQRGCYYFDNSSKFAIKQ
jgi:tetratricopeptide (TPR) repeat protein